MSKKRAREPVNIDTELVEIFEDLSNPSEELRLKAAQLLISKVKTEKLDVRKILKRLLRGLCSGRKAARPGFSVALTEFLRQNVLVGGGGDTLDTDLSPHEVVTFLREQTKIGGNVGSQEKRDHHLGRIFGAGAIIKSKILFPSLPGHETWPDLLQLLFELVKRKSSLRKECGWVLYEATQVLKSVTDGNVYVQSILDMLQENRLVRTPEGVAIWIVARQSFSDLRIPEQAFYKGDPLHRKERSSLAQILTESSSGTESGDVSAQAKHRGMWYPKPHFAWDIVFNASFSHDDTKFSDLWIKAVDNGLFAQSSSDERKYWGFCLFQKWVVAAPLAELQTIFGENMLRCLTNQLSSKRENLQGVVVDSLRAIQRRGSNEPDAIPELLLSMLESSNYVSFTKTAEKLLSQASPTHFHEITIDFEGLIDDPSLIEEKGIGAYRQTLADLLVTVIRSSPSPDTTEPSLALFREMVCSILQMFAVYAYFDGAAAPHSKPVTEATRNMFRSRITSCLTNVMTKDPDLTFHPYNLVRFLHPKEGSRQPLFSQSADKDVSEAVDQGWKTLQTVRAEESNSFNQAFVILYATTILQVYNGEADALAILNELQEHRHNLAENSSSGHADAADGILEIILSLMSKPSLLFRRLGKEVFSAFTSTISKNGIASMIRILETLEDVAGQDDLFDKDDWDTNVEIVDVEDDTDVQEVGESEEETSFTGDGSSEHSDDGDAAAGRDDVLEAKLAELLGTRLVGDDNVAAEEDEGESDEDMDDEQMEALTPYIENTFKEQGKESSKKKEKKEAKEAIIQLKSRVLELVEIYVKQQPLDVKVLKIIKPLLLLINSTSSKQVSERSSNLMREASRGYKLKPELDHSDPHDGTKEVGTFAKTLLPEVHELALQAGSNAYGNACSQASLLLVKVLLNNGGGSIRDVLDQYSSTCERALVDSTCKYRVGFHLDFHNWAQSARDIICKLER